MGLKTLKSVLKLYVIYKYQCVKSGSWTISDLTLTVFDSMTKINEFILILCFAN